MRLTAASPLYNTNSSQPTTESTHNPNIYLANKSKQVLAGQKLKLHTAADLIKATAQQLYKRAKRLRVL
jgi:hypothetical protein